MTASADLVLDVTPLLERAARGGALVAESLRRFASVLDESRAAADASARAFEVEFARMAARCAASSSTVEGLLRRMRVADHVHSDEPYGGPCPGCWGIGGAGRG